MAEMQKVDEIREISVIFSLVVFGHVFHANHRLFLHPPAIKSPIVLQADLVLLKGSV